MSTDSQRAPRPLPDRPNLRHLKDQAKDLLKTGAAATIAHAQFKVARLYGFASWPKLKDYVSYCTLSWLCRGEGRLLGRSASLAFENGVLVQRFVETSPDIVVMMLLQQPLSSPSIDCSERHTVPHAHLFRRE